MFVKFLAPEPLRNDPVLRHNYTVNVLDGAFFALGMSVISQQTILPVFVKNIGGNNIWIGLIPVVWTICFNFPQIFIAHYSQRLQFKKTLMLRTGFIQRIPLLFLSVFTFYAISRISTAAGLIAFFVLFGIAAFGGSLHMPVWFDLVIKVTPVRIRGRLFAIRAIFGSILGIAGGWIAVVILRSFEFPLNFSLLFACAFVVTMLSFIFLTQLQEREATRTPHPLRLSDTLGSIPHLIRNNYLFRNFLVADALIIVASVSNAFYTVHAFAKFDLPDSYAGLFTIYLMLSTIIASIVAGYLADQRGHRLNLIIASSGTLAGCLVALTAANVYLYFLVFFLSAASITFTIISRLPFVAELCSEENRGTYVAVTNLVTSPFVLFGVLAGWAADTFGYYVVFTSAAVTALIAVAFIIRRISEPRFVTDSYQ